MQQVQFERSALSSGLRGEVTLLHLLQVLLVMFTKVLIILVIEPLTLHSLALWGRLEEAFINEALDDRQGLPPPC